MHDEIRITTNGTGEVRVVRLRQSEVTFRLGIIHSSLHAFKQPDFDRVFRRMSLNRLHQFAHFRRNGQVTRGDPKTLHQSLKFE